MSAHVGARSLAFRAKIGPKRLDSAQFGARGPDRSSLDRASARGRIGPTLCWYLVTEPRPARRLVSRSSRTRMTGFVVASLRPASRVVPRTERSRMWRRWSMRRVIAVCGLVWIATSCAQVREPESTNAGSSSDARPTAAISGKATPPVQPALVTAKLQVLERNLSRSSAGLRAESIGDGVQKVDLQGRFLHATVLEHRAAGAQRRACVEHPSAMVDMFTR
jgi:hypothetical protein